MTYNIKSFPVYQVKFERLSGVIERIGGIFWFSDFLGRISGWRVAGSWSRINLLTFLYFEPKLLGYSLDWFIQSQKDSPSLNLTHRNKYILLTQLCHAQDTWLPWVRGVIHELCNVVNLNTIFEGKKLFSFHDLKVFDYSTKTSAFEQWRGATTRSESPGPSLPHFLQPFTWIEGHNSSPQLKTINTRECWQKE